MVTDKVIAEKLTELRNSFEKDTDGSLLDVNIDFGHILLDFVEMLELPKDEQVEIMGPKLTQDLVDEGTLVRKVFAPSSRMVMSERAV